MTILDTTLQALGLLCLLAGVLFCGLGVLGLFRMPDVYTRMHAGSKAIAVGAPLVLLGAALLSPLDVALKSLAAIAFLLLTTPVATIATARAAHARREPMTDRTVRDDLARDRHFFTNEERPPGPE